MRDQRTLFDLTQDGLIIGKKIQRIYPEFAVSTFVSDVRTEMEGQTIYNVTKAIGRVLRQHLPENYADALAILMDYVNVEAPSEPTRHPTPEVETSLRPISHFVSLYGLADFDASLDAFCELSKHHCTRGGEIREFLIKDPNRCLERFSEWVKDENANLRFSFSLQSRSDAEQTILTYYAVAYKRPSGHITRKRYRLSQRKLKPRQRVDYEKSLFPLPSLKQHHDGRACLGWHRFELEVNGDVLGGFDFEVTAPKDPKANG